MLVKREMMCKMCDYSVKRIKLISITSTVYNNNKY